MLADNRHPSIGFRDPILTLSSIYIHLILVIFNNSLSSSLQMSAILSADDLNDFISPGVACVKPVELAKNDQEAGEVEIQIDENGNPLEISKIDGKVAALSPAQISLADCLACSGCITSAEEVLVAQHSHEQLLKAIQENDNKKVFVASISHQLRASLARAYKLPVGEMDRLLVNLLANQMGFQYIVGTALGRKLSLLQEAQGVMSRRLADGSSKAPVLLSICPGWVLYAEKTHPYVLPMLSTTKSPQQITGCLLKTLVAKELGISRSDIYHLSIMPCFDKKLESARPENTPVETAAPDVDCVLTAKELVNLLENLKYELMPTNAAKIASQNTNIYNLMAPTLWPHKELSWANDSGSLSGGYAYNYLMLTRNHMVCTRPETYLEADFEVVTIEGKNSDLYELRLMHKPSGQKIASAAVVNGFKNIQNLVRKLKPAPGGASKQGKVNPLAARRRARMGANNGSPASEAASDTADASKCDYVEVMACPDGCINGGGQITRPQDIAEKEWLSQVKDIYRHIGTVDISSMDNAEMAKKLEQWAESFCEESQIPTERLFATHFNEVEKPTDPNAVLLGAKW